MRERHVSTFEPLFSVEYPYILALSIHPFVQSSIRTVPSTAVFLKNAVGRNIVFIAASLKYARLMFPIGDRVDNGRALRSNKDDVSPCA